MLPDMVQPTGLALCIPLPHPGVHRAPEGRPLTTLRPTTPPALQRLRNWKDVEDELEEIQQEEDAQKAAGFVSVWKLFVTRSMRWQLTSIIILMAGQQLSGVNAVRGVEPASQPALAKCRGSSPHPLKSWAFAFQIYYYANQIYGSTGVQPDHIQYVTVGTGAINMVATLVSVSVWPSSQRLLDRLGRTWLRERWDLHCFAPWDPPTPSLALDSP